MLPDGGAKMLDACPFAKKGFQKVLLQYVLEEGFGEKGSYKGF